CCDGVDSGRIKNSPPLGNWLRVMDWINSFLVMPLPSHVTMLIGAPRLLWTPVALLLALSTSTALVPAPSISGTASPLAQASLGLPQQAQGSIGVIAPVPQQQQPVLQTTTVAPLIVNPSDSPPSQFAAPVMAFSGNPGLRQQAANEAPARPGGLPYYAVVLIVIGSLVLATALVGVTRSPVEISTNADKGAVQGRSNAKEFIACEPSSRASDELSRKVTKPPTIREVPRPSWGRLSLTAMCLRGIIAITTTTLMGGALLWSGMGGPNIACSTSLSLWPLSAVPAVTYV
ncbi:hypothetical protein FOZ63_025877, partial [Perkinsus olseni]